MTPQHINDWNFKSCNVCFNEINSQKKGNQGILRNMLVAQMSMNDYKLIQYKKQLLQPQDSRQFHVESMEWLTKELNSYQHHQQQHQKQNNDDGEEAENKNTNHKKICIVSHHLPSYHSISKQFKNSPLNPAFASSTESALYFVILYI